MPKAKRPAQVQELRQLAHLVKLERAAQDLRAQAAIDAHQVRLAGKAPATSNKIRDRAAVVHRAHQAALVRRLDELLVSCGHLPVRGA